MTKLFINRQRYQSLLRCVLTHQGCVFISLFNWCVVERTICKSFHASQQLPKKRASEREDRGEQQDWIQWQEPLTETTTTYLEINDRFYKIRHFNKLASLIIEVSIFYCLILIIMCLLGNTGLAGKWGQDGKESDYVRQRLRTELVT